METPQIVDTLSKAKRLSQAFESVFGQPNRRSSDQRLVLEHLHKCCGRDQPVFQVDKEGRFDPIRAAHIDGAQTQFLIIERQCEIARANEAKKTKPKVTKE